MKKGENDIKEEQAPTNVLRSERNPQSDKKTKQLKPKFASKTVLQKSLTKQNKNKKSRDTEIETGRQNRNWHISSKITRLTFLYIGSFFTHPMLASFFMWEFLYTSHAGFFFYVGSFFTHPMLASFFMWGVSLTHPVLASFLRGEFFLHIPCWLNFHLGSFSYTSHAGFIFMCGVSSRHPMLASFLCVEFLTLPELASLLCGEFLLHIPCWLFFFFF